MSDIVIIDEDTFAYDYASLEPDHSFIRAMKRGKSHAKRIYQRYNEQVTQKYAEVEEGRAVYRQMLAEGKVRPPTRIERLITKANGHEDNAATQAARGLLTRYGVTWETTDE